MKIKGRTKARWDTLPSTDPHWLQGALKFLAIRDYDRASELNGIGFSKFDTEAGHSLANMSPNQFLQYLPQARILCQKYRGQLDLWEGAIAPPPDPPPTVVTDTAENTTVVPEPPKPVLDPRITTALASFSKFRELREEQIKALGFILSSSKQIIVINAPTGVGKTLVGMIVGRILGPIDERLEEGGMVYLPHTKLLQDQIARDFPEAEVLKGRGNYPCLRNTLLTADCCTSKSCVYKNHTHKDCEECGYFDEDEEGCTRICKFRSKCPYRMRKEIVLKSQLRILNYAYFINEVNYMGQFGGKPVVVCDEADSLEGMVLDFISVKISKSMLLRFKLELPKFKTAKAGMKIRPRGTGASPEGDIKEWIDWAKNTKIMVNGLIRTREDSKTAEEIKEKKTLEGIKGKLENFMKYADDTWLYEENNGDGGHNGGHSGGHRGFPYYEFKPTWLTVEMAKEYFWGHGERFILMSATFPPKPIIAKTLGLEPGDIDYLELSSPFPAENRKVVVRPVANLTYKDFDREVPKTVEGIQDILKKHSEEKGIIHTVSYKLAKYIMDTKNPRLITHDSKNTKEVIERFRESKEPLVLVSPSMERGLDLYGDLGRFAIWCKCPYLSLGDKQVSARLYGSGKIGELWYKSAAVTSIVQGAGRIVRNMEDYGTTYILDKQVLKILRENPLLFPGWFRKAVFIEKSVY